MNSSVKILWRLVFAGLIFIIIIFILANFGMFGKIPSMQDLQHPEAELASEIYTTDGVLMGKYYTENRSEVKYNEISPNVIHALIATEDERFYEHSGIDAKAVLRAVATFGKDGGGSTLTQQLAKMILKQGRGNILTRGFQKIKEWIVAVKLEKNFTKEEIIALYLNRASWGNLYGIRNASRSYFQKEPKDLNVEEAAVLVGMLKGFIYDPIRHPKAGKDRRNTVIEKMADCQQHFLTTAEAAKYKAMPIKTNFKKLDENVGIAPYFRDVLRTTLKDWCKEHKNPKTGENFDLMRDGLKIYTTINSKMQQYAEEAVVQHMPIIQAKLNSSLKYNAAKMWKDHGNAIEAAMKYTDRWQNMEDDSVSEEDIRKSFFIPVRMKVFAWNEKRQVDTVMTPYDSIKYHKQLLQTSFAAMDPKTGEVKCWVGGIDYKWFKFDHITAQRQVGSTIKPLIYSLAIQDAGYTPATVIPGGPVQYGNEVRSFGGGGTVAYCLAHSKNVASVRITNMVGVSRVIEFARNCGIQAKLPPYASLALGAAEIPMLEMLQAYTMFPNYSFNTKPILITRIEDKSGNILETFQSENKQVMSEATAYTMITLMEGVIKFGTAHSLNNYNIPVQKAGKTGTTNGNADGWFIGYTPELLAGTWVGCEDPFIRIYSGTAGGSEMAAPKWGIFMSKVYADKSLSYGKIKEFIKPGSGSNEVIQADAIDKLFSQGDSSTVDIGNGDAGDFIDSPATKNNTIEKERSPYEEDTNKAFIPNKKPEDKKDVKLIPTPVIKPTDDKNKKTLKKDKPKTNPENDY